MAPRAAARRLAASFGQHAVLVRRELGTSQAQLEQQLGWSWSPCYVQPCL